MEPWTLFSPPSLTATLISWNCSYHFRLPHILYADVECFWNCRRWLAWSVILWMRARLKCEAWGREPVLRINTNISEGCKRVHFWSNSWNSGTCSDLELVRSRVKFLWMWRIYYQESKGDLLKHRDLEIVAKIIWIFFRRIEFVGDWGMFSRSQMNSGRWIRGVWRSILCQYCTGSTIFVDRN